MRRLVSAVELMWDQMWRSTINYGRKGLPLQCISAVDLAIWDLLGILRNEPVYALLGGKTKQRLPVYNTTARPGALAARHSPCKAAAAAAAPLRAPVAPALVVCARSWLKVRCRRQISPRRWASSAQRFPVRTGALTPPPRHTQKNHWGAWLAARAGHLEQRGLKVWWGSASRATAGGRIRSEGRSKQQARSQSQSRVKSRSKNKSQRSIHISSTANAAAAAAAARKTAVVPARTISSTSDSSSDSQRKTRRWSRRSAGTASSLAQPHRQHAAWAQQSSCRSRAPLRLSAIGCLTGIPPRPP